MTLRKELGKIVDVKLGTGGYQGAMFGLTVHIETKSGAAFCFSGYWANRPKDAEWTKEFQNEKFLGVILKIKNLMLDAKLSDFKDLKGVPVEVVWDSGQNPPTLESFRILKEVI